MKTFNSYYRSISLLDCFGLRLPDKVLYAVVTKPNTFVANTTIDPSQVNDNFDTLYNEFNGNIDNSNIDSSAAIAVSKIASGSAGQVLKTIGGTPTWQALKQIVVATRDATNITTTNTSYEDVPLLTVTLTTIAGTTLKIHTQLGGVRNSVTNERVFFIVNIDGVDEGEESIIVTESATGAGDAKTLSGLHVKTGLSAGSHTIKIRWKVSGNTGSLGNAFAGSQLVVEEL